MKKTIKCVLIDDEIPGLTFLKRLCEQIDRLEIVKVYNQSEKFLHDKDSLDFDLCITDIQMPGLSGVELVHLMPDIYFIFTTAYKEYAVEAYELDVVDYITKPVKMERLEKAIEKVVLLMDRQEPENVKTPTLTVNTDKGKMVLLHENIKYIRVATQDSRDKIMHLGDGTEILVKNISFEKLAAALKSPQFIRVNKGEMIATAIVTYYSHDLINTSLNIASKPLKLTLGAPYKNDFIKVL